MNALREGLREGKKAKTRAAIRRHALRLPREQGYTATTVQQIFYVAVADLQATLDKVGELGGTTVTPPMDVPGGPTIAFFADPAGNRILTPA
jgi:hypothetical protein